jgi:hypothetical protein
MHFYILLYFIFEDILPVQQIKSSLIFSPPGQVGVNEGEGIHDDPLRVRAPHLHPERLVEDDLLPALQKIWFGPRKLLRPALQSAQYYSAQRYGLNEYC